MKCFPGLTRFNFSVLLGGKILSETNIQNRWHKLDEKLLSSVVYDHITAWLSLFIFGALHLLEIQRQQKKLYYVLYVDIRRKENKEKTKNISQK